ncbi:RNA polymerase sigma factor [Streptomyces stelliscabiei]|uniref:RNA polymerase sigma factor n=1 Tax=Streptomyces stelliscabiei TaxID=146820 RepID=UPI0029B556E0|nr:RNA polymerase sigma factor [Streptomyces stelliscabiei]MDX2557259.1 RNA polymerase sigma factor [Streptomyces stelliscabiei]MDX2616351.1 RNA polymerase sigma factor [Streptomyces stelliscabiei]MDX2641052.1 RNA polymerase sigma factor [Streptomyces stelliscabiei]MDX2665114.1 RNA polymerase sigma factor [Streptomyces stelliscabiei]MDX2716211.1 RNA polymerase sigma factor [Streptomyces stelliscabiei]
MRPSTARISPRWSGYIRRRIGDRGEAEALAHEIWIAFLRRFDHYQQVYDNPVGALFVIARRKVADWRQEQDKAPDLPGDDGLGDRLAQIAQDRMDMIGLAGLRIDLSRAVARLTPRQREALLLRYVDGLDRQAVASLMGITVDGVKKLISTAVKTLRTAQDLASYPPPTTTSRMHREVRK